MEKKGTPEVKMIINWRNDEGEITGKIAVLGIVSMNRKEIVFEGINMDTNENEIFGVPRELLIEFFGFLK